MSVMLNLQLNGRKNSSANKLGICSAASAVLCFLMKFRHSPHTEGALRGREAPPAVILTWVPPPPPVRLSQWVVRCGVDSRSLRSGRTPGHVQAAEALPAEPWICSRSDRPLLSDRWRPGTGLKSAMYRHSRGGSPSSE